MTRKSKREPRHVRIYDHEIETAAFNDLSSDAKALLIEIRRLGWPKTNGLESITVRQIMRYLKVGAPRAEEALQELIDHGFLAITKPKAKGHAARYRRTDATCKATGRPPTYDYVHWNPPMGAGRRGRKDSSTYRCIRLSRSR